MKLHLNAYLGGWQSFWHFSLLFSLVSRWKPLWNLRKPSRGFGANGMVTTRRLAAFWDSNSVEDISRAPSHSGRVSMRNCLDHPTRHCQSLKWKTRRRMKESKKKLRPCKHAPHRTMAFLDNTSTGKARSTPCRKSSLPRCSNSRAPCSIDRFHLKLFQILKIRNSIRSLCTPKDHIQSHTWSSSTDAQLLASSDLHDEARHCRTSCCWK